MQTKKEKVGMRWAKIRVNKHRSMATPERKGITENAIVQQVNIEYDCTLAPSTVQRYVREGMIGVSPLKRGPAGHFPPAVYDLLKGAYSTFLKLEQAESKG